MSRPNIQGGELGNVDVNGPIRGGHFTVPDAATFSVPDEMSGRTLWIPDLTATCTISLPAEAIGLTFKFVYAGGAADAQNFVITSGADANYFKGGVLHIDSDADAAGDEAVPVYADGNSNSKLTVVTPGIGTEITVWCEDGTTWRIYGHVVSATVPAFADQ